MQSWREHSAEKFDSRLNSVKHIGLHSGEMELWAHATKVDRCIIGTDMATSLAVESIWWFECTAEDELPSVQ